MFLVISVIFTFLFTYSSFVTADAIETLQQAEAAAIENDPLLKALIYKQQSNIYQSQAAQYWQDPKIKFGLSNVPIDSFELDQEAMTQLKVGISQQFPQGDSLQIRSQQFSLKSDEQKSQHQLRFRNIKKQVRLSWLKILLEKHSLAVLRQNKQLINEFLELSETNYASGRSSQQNIFQTELKLSLIDDKIDEMQMRLNIAQEELQRWTGQLIPLTRFKKPIDQLIIANINSPVEQQKNRLIKHPELLILQQKIDQMMQQIELNKQDFNAQWGMEVSYGKRFGTNPNGSSRSDFMTALVNMKYPLWGKQKQQKTVAASQSQLSALKMEYQNKEIILNNQLEKIHQRLTILHKRLYNYQQNIEYRSLQNTDASLISYQNSAGNFKDVLNARETQLTIGLSRLKLDYQLTVQKIQLLYLLGDSGSVNSLSVNTRSVTIRSENRENK